METNRAANTGQILMVTRAGTHGGRDIFQIHFAENGALQRTQLLLGDFSQFGDIQGFELDPTGNAYINFNAIAGVASFSVQARGGKVHWNADALFPDRYPFDPNSGPTEIFHLSRLDAVEPYQRYAVLNLKISDGLFLAVTTMWTDKQMAELLERHDLQRPVPKGPAPDGKNFH